MNILKGKWGATLALSAALAATGQAFANSEFEYGPVFVKFGKHASVDGVKFAENQTFKVAFDVAKADEPGKVNRSVESLARFINMLVTYGLKKEDLSLAMVVQCSATEAMRKTEHFKQRKGQPNGNKLLIRALIKQGVEVIVCGQSAAAHGVEKNALIDGVKVDLSAMTAHARLAQKVYSVNPF